MTAGQVEPAPVTRACDARRNGQSGHTNRRHLTAQNNLKVMSSGDDSSCGCFNEKKKLTSFEAWIRYVHNRGYLQ